MSAILKDIVKDNKRAGEIIWRMKALVRKENLELDQLDLATVVRDVALLLRCNLAKITDLSY